MSVLPIETARLRIRALEDSDVDGAHRVYGDPDVMRYVGADGKARTRSRARRERGPDHGRPGEERLRPVGGRAPRHGRDDRRVRRRPRRRHRPRRRARLRVPAAQPGGRGTRPRPPAPAWPPRSARSALERIIALAYPENAPVDPDHAEAAACAARARCTPTATSSSATRHWRPPPAARRRRRRPCGPGCTAAPCNNGVRPRCCRSPRAARAAADIGIRPHRRLAFSAAPRRAGAQPRRPGRRPASAPAPPRRPPRRA